MRALAVDTSTDRTGVALWQDGACVLKRETEEPARHAEHLIPLIDEALGKAGWKKTHLELLGCCIGPGSFTGVRVGLATIKGIALALDLPVMGIGSLEAMASAARGAAAGVYVPLLQAGKGEWYWAVYDADGGLVAGPGHIGGRDLATVVEPWLHRDPLVLGDVAAEWVGPDALAGDVGQKLFGARVLRRGETDRPDAVEVARLAVQMHAKGSDVGLHALEPIYVRPPDITWPRSTPSLR
jgi:tRNA threonylcarbamoyladenosine biosynthesis protein TsaB